MYRIIICSSHNIWTILQEGKTMGLGENVNKQFYDFPYKYDGIITDYSDFLKKEIIILNKFKKPDFR